jgi:hypothetical protein
MYMRKALVTVISIWCHRLILLLKVMPRYVTLFTKGMHHPFICSMTLGTVSLLEK